MGVGRALLRAHVLQCSDELADVGAHRRDRDVRVGPGVGLRFGPGNGKGVVASIPKVNGAYDVKTLSEHLMKIKKNYPEKTDAIVLLEPDIEYDYMIKVMDAVRSAEIVPPGKTEIVKAELFPDMSIGLAP